MNEDASIGTFLSARSQVRERGRTKRLDSTKGEEEKLILQCRTAFALRCRMFMQIDSECVD